MEIAATAELAGAASDAELEHRVILGEVEMALGAFIKLQVGALLDLRKFDLARVLVDDLSLIHI